MNPDAGSLSGFDPRAPHALTVIDLGGEPWSLAFTPDGATLLVVDRAQGRLLAVDPLRAIVRDQLELGPEPAQVVVHPASSTGTYGFQLWNVPAPQQFAIAIGDTVSDGAPAAGAGNIETPGARDTYTFTATAGQQIQIERLSLTTGMAQTDWQLVDSVGTVVFSLCLGCIITAQHTLTLGGTYTLTMGNNTVDATGAYSFRITEFVP